ncbi:recombinase family protein [Ferroacidibacillus organovorans]|uniref:recombinase family protein n=1 Tax=Ferroacidibacillus organovorans TaxID=1765683 RepID=UPI0018D342D8|nr:recombinase family protein [Ferroacidibacillus organovorans]
MYIRVSTAQQNIAMQEGSAGSILSQFPASQIHRFIDEGVSATKTKLRERPGLQKLIQSIQHREIGTVVVYDRSRISRNTYEYIAFVKIIQSYNVRVIFTGDKEPAFTSSHFIEAFYALHAQGEGKKIRQRALDAQRHFPSKLIGYIKIEENGQVRYIRDEPRATYIQSLFEKMANVSTTVEMESVFLQYRAKIKRPYLRLFKILNTPFYSAIVLNENQCQQLEYVEPITTQDLYNRVKQNLNVIASADQQVKTEQLSYRMMPVCGYCGEPMSVQSGDYFHRKMATYVCKTKIHRRNAISIQEYENEIMSIIYDYLKSIDIKKMEKMCFQYIREQEMKSKNKKRSLEQALVQINVEIVTFLAIKKRTDALLKRKEQLQVALRDQDAMIKRLDDIKVNFSEMAYLIKVRLISDLIQDSDLWDLAEDLICQISVFKSEIKMVLRCKTFIREGAF